MSQQLTSKVFMPSQMHLLDFSKDQSHARTPIYPFIVFSIVYVDIRPYLYVCMYIYIYIYIYISMFVFSCIHMFTYAHIHIHIFIINLR